MSHFNEIEVDCPKCTEAFSATVWTSLHVGEDPELKDLLLGGELNILNCDHCQHQFFYENFLIYQDPGEELIAYVYPEHQHSQEAELKKLMLSGFRDAMEGLDSKDRLDYEPILLFGLGTLVELIQDEEGREAESLVADTVCRENKILTIVLRASRARPHEIPRILPVVGAGPQRTRVLAGLHQLIQFNPALRRYSKLETTLTADTNWELPK